MEINFDPKKLQIVEIDQVRPNDWNPKKENTVELEEVKKSIQTKGLRLPIVVRENNGLEIIDGEQRWTACKALGYAKVLIYNEGKVSDAEARELTLFYETHVPINEVDLAFLVKQMVSDYPEINFPYSDERVSDLVKMADFDWQTFNGELIDIQTSENNLSLDVPSDKVKEIKKFIEGLEQGKKKSKLNILATTKIPVSEAQAKVIHEALSKIMTKEGIENKARALELICADYLS